MPLEPLVELVDFGPLLAEPSGVQPVDHRHPLRVVGDGDVLQAALLAAAAISSIVAVPSVHVLCMCRSPRMSPSSTSSGSSPASAHSNSRRASRSSGGKQGRSSVA